MRVTYNEALCSMRTQLTLKKKLIFNPLYSKVVNYFNVRSVI